MNYLILHTKNVIYSIILIISFLFVETAYPQCNSKEANNLLLFADNRRLLPLFHNALSRLPSTDECSDTYFSKVTDLSSIVERDSLRSLYNRTVLTIKDRQRYYLYESDKSSKGVKNALNVISNTSKIVLINSYLLYDETYEYQMYYYTNIEPGNTVTDSTGIKTFAPEIIGSNLSGQFSVLISLREKQSDIRDKIRNAVKLLVKSSNFPPIAKVTANGELVAARDSILHVRQGEPLSLDASTSFDPDDNFESLTPYWQQVMEGSVDTPQRLTLTPYEWRQEIDTTVPGYYQLLLRVRDQSSGSGSLLLKLKVDSTKLDLFEPLALGLAIYRTKGPEQRVFFSDGNIEFQSSDPESDWRLSAGINIIHYISIPILARSAFSNRLHEKEYYKRSWNEHSLLNRIYPYIRINLNLTYSIPPGPPPFGIALQMSEASFFYFGLHPYIRPSFLKMSERLCFPSTLNELGNAGGLTDYCNLTPDSNRRYGVSFGFTIMPIINFTNKERQRY